MFLMNSSFCVFLHNFTNPQNTTMIISVTKGNNNIIRALRKKVGVVEKLFAAVTPAKLQIANVKY
jgi:hypothetical protein